MDISDLLSVFTSSDSVTSLSKSTGAQPSQVSALIQSAIPILMKGMQQNAASESGAASLAKALDAHAGSNTSNIGSLLKNIDVADGAKILGHILGGKNSQVQSGLAQKTGLSSSQTTAILASVAPMLLSVLGGQKNKANVGSGGLGSMLTSLIGGSGGGLDDVISVALADKDGDGTPDVLQKLGGLFGFGKK
ncbi:hypothetical protein M2459_002157 [Parabacteroides sp. PF5-5]|uniref:DUF937 domain-containing protein n=1 Tax=unclassified Parabacteroides TaxID=2649774 RepID=UPI0024734E6A|nr:MULTISPECIES: DUF937 domain-containing protein [unclassified Parabacteroides]MDH6306827.1 hypothetical protein [Parabacteroides sp. PH5-39]MDH6316272.1 hypothetical protein [Parabacteroides sp. PF5-13]MDH6319755.1 hypothetical protein [Parabacteroides sp. PH5-13]MDH6323653.1 hypothetical protein [Parabacteroides sp. PH5-8]MDH6327459.1 hypothetical protein [Parabacteroides sp. PH5-41]